MTFPQEERFVWWLWQSRHFDGSKLRSKGVDVIFPGWFSTAPGPDFRDAIISDASGRLRRGDIEIHIATSDWKHHGHESDPNYNRVILHVVLEEAGRQDIQTANGKRVTTVELATVLTEPLPSLLLNYAQWKPEIVRCPTDLIGTEEIVSVICDGGARRFAGKVQRTTADVEAIGADEALYQGLAESLGYSENREPFRKIAEALPFALLASLTTLQSETLLLAAAGLTSGQGLLSAYIDEPVLRPGELKTFRVRPSNSPSSRLRGLARLVHLHRRGLTGALSEHPVQELWRQFAIEADTVLVGRGRARDIVVNVALPYLTGYESVDGVEELRRLGPPPDNRWVTALRKKLAGSGTTIRPYRALHQQGLLELSLRFCRFDHCEACPLHVQMDGVADS